MTTSWPLLPASMTDTARANRLCELNVLRQVVNTCQTTIVQDAWKRGHPLAVHGLIYSLDDGLIRDLRLSVPRAGDLDREYQAALAAIR